MATLKWDPHTGGAQYIEDLATAYWYSEVLFLAMEQDLFEILKDRSALSAEALGRLLNLDADALKRYLHLLKELDLVSEYQGMWSNSTLSETFLLKDSPQYQGDNIRWRQGLRDDWRTMGEALAAGHRVHFLPEDIPEKVLNERRLNYIQAMDNIALSKIREILPFFSNCQGDILDVGAGSGAFSRGFLEAFPKCRATLVDIRQMIPITEKYLKKRCDERVIKRMTFVACNILDDNWPIDKTYDLIILSNIVHAYGHEENKNVFNEVKRLLKPGGMVLIHDFFLEHWPIKGHFSDMNMFVNTFNGRVYKAADIQTLLKEKGFITTPLLPLPSDTALIVAALSEETLNQLQTDPMARLYHPVKSLGFEELIPIAPDQVVLSEFAKSKCSFGCRSSHQKECKDNDLYPVKRTASLLADYSRAYLLKSQPPTDVFQRKALQAEALAFKEGFYKAFVFWAGPCSICPNCDKTQPCNNRKHKRPSMEGAGIDVYATVAQVGENMHTLKEMGEYIKYYALLLLE